MHAKIRYIATVNTVLRRHVHFRSFQLPDRLKLRVLQLASRGWRLRVRVEEVARRGQETGKTENSSILILWPSLSNTWARLYIASFVAIESKFNFSNFFGLSSFLGALPFKRWLRPIGFLATPTSKQALICTLQLTNRSNGLVTSWFVYGDLF